MKPITDFFTDEQENHNNNEDDIDTVNANNDILHQDINIIRKDAIAEKFNEGKSIRNHLFCQNIVELNGIKYKCHYHNRPGRYERDHDCSLNIEHAKRTLDQFVTTTSVLKFFDTSKISLEEHVALVCAELNFSIKSVCSPQFNDLLLRFIKAGQDSQSFGVFPRPNMIYKKQNRNSLRQKIIDLSNKTLNTQCQLASISSPISAALDAGTVAHNHFVDILFTDILKGTGTFLFDSYSSSSFDAQKYFKMGKDVIDKAISNKIKISSFVGDRLRAQVKALDHLHPESIQNKFFDNPDYCSVLFVPCICHILNRSLLNSIKKVKISRKVYNY